MSLISTQNIGPAAAAALPVTPQSAPANQQQLAQGAITSQPVGQIVGKQLADQPQARILSDKERSGPQSLPNKRAEDPYATQEEGRGDDSSSGGEAAATLSGSGGRISVRA